MQARSFAADSTAACVCVEILDETDQFFDHKAPFGWFKGVVWIKVRGESEPRGVGEESGSNWNWRV